LKVPEYFQFDPTEDYLKPSLQGVRRIGNDYVAIELVHGRLPSDVLGLHLERSGPELKLWDPARGSWLLTPRERAEHERQRAEAAEQREAMDRRAAEETQRRLEAEIERLRREIEAIRRGQADPEQR
jgi:hypothetical protein